MDDIVRMQVLDDSEDLAEIVESAIRAQLADGDEKVFKSLRATGRSQHDDGPSLARAHRELCCKVRWEIRRRVADHAIPVEREQIGMPERSDPIQVRLDFADLSLACASVGQ